MESGAFIEHLMEFRLTRQEAAIYECLLSEGKTTGYEVAKTLGISRSNAYNSLASMTEKGAAYMVEEGSTRKYVPVPLQEFVRNQTRRLEDAGQWLINNQPAGKTQDVGYITIEGARNIQDKMKSLLLDVKERAYISCTSNYLLLFVEELEKVDQEHKLVIITDQPISFGNAKVYVGSPRGTQVGLITDSRYVLTGEFGEGSLNSCLYSGQKNFVKLYRRALSNEIKLMEIQDRRTFKGRKN